MTTKLWSTSRSCACLTSQTSTTSTRCATSRESACATWVVLRSSVLPDLVIIPGSKTTMADLDWLRAQGLAERILAARGDGTPISRYLCAGYQMLGESLLDPDGVESSREESRGLGLLPTSTTFLREKSTHQVKGRVAEGRGLLSECQDAEVTAYEIHMGVTSGDVPSQPFLMETRSGRRVDMPDGALDGEGLTLGTYLHGLFHNRAVRRSILGYVAERRGATLPAARDDIEPSAEYDKLASSGTRAPRHGTRLSRDRADVAGGYKGRSTRLTGGGITSALGSASVCMRQPGRHEVHIVRLRSHELVNTP